jgi:hypothetical protein
MMLVRLNKPSAPRTVAYSTENLHAMHHDLPAMRQVVNGVVSNIIHQHAKQMCLLYCHRLY